MSRARWSAAIAAAATCLALAAPARADTQSIIAPDMEIDVGDAGDIAAGFVSSGFNTLLPSGEAGLQVGFPGSPGTVVGIGDFSLVQQGVVTGSGTTADPYTVQTIYNAPADTPTLQVTQTVAHVTGDPRVKVDLVFKNLTAVPLAFRAFEWGDVQGGGFGQGVGSFAPDYLAGVFASQGSATGLEPVTPWDHFEETDDAPLSNQLDDPNAQLNGTVDGADLHDPAVAAEYDENLAASGTATVDVNWRFVPGAANLALTPDDGSGSPDQPACFTATVTTAYGAPVPDVAVDFAAGDPHPDLEAPTNAQGQATYCVTAAEPDEELFVEADVDDALLSAFSTWTFTGPPSGGGGGTSTTAPPPVAGQTVQARLLTGKVRIRHGTSWTALTGTRTLKLGTTLDARHGTVALTAVVAGHNRRGAFGGGIFRVRQVTAKAPAEVMLSGGAFGACRAGSTRVVRRLKAVARGHWDVVGHVSVATGSASWTTQDRCDGTLTAVQTGTVRVSDPRRHRSVAVHAHHRALVKRG